MLMGVEMSDIYIYLPQNKAVDIKGQFYGQFYIPSWSGYVFVGIKNNINVISNFFRTSEENLPNLKRGAKLGLTSMLRLG